MRKLNKIPQSKETFAESFEKLFPNEDFEHFGTLLIRLSLVNTAKKEGTKIICTGANLEDVLSDSLHQLCNGNRILGVPYRFVSNDIKLIFPLWLAPKKIIDGCFQKYSLDNYQIRYPGFSFGRALYYQMAYSIQSNFPEMAERMIQGLSLMSHRDDKPLYDKDLGFHVLENINIELKEKFLKIFKR